MSKKLTAALAVRAPPERYKAAYELCSQMLRFPLSERAGHHTGQVHQTRAEVLRYFGIDPNDAEKVYAFEQSLALHLKGRCNG